ncbi:MAG: hypothetical protein IID36_07760, partial [Planctomycetes bacterium]|nr:hypothetical protein [Planctomycetota bacterium]
MTRPYRPTNLADVKTYSVTQRQHKSTVNRMCGLPPAGASVAELVESLPGFLGAESFRRIVEAVVAAVRSDRPVVAAMGAHVVKVGCGPIIIDLIRRGVIKAIACNGATAIHDVELAIIGETSEEVADTIRDGSFGMVAETMEFFDSAVSMAAKGATGLGDA